MPRILLVEDNKRLSELISSTFVREGFNCDCTFSADEAHCAITEGKYDIIILDLGLPDEDGMEFIRKLRTNKNSIPILILTARDSMSEKVKGLNFGADDYMTKPFSNEELIARICAILRRPTQEAAIILSFGNLAFDTVSRVAQIDGCPVRLTRRETDLLETFCRSHGKILSKNRLEKIVYSVFDEITPNAIEVLIHRLKRKLESNYCSHSIYTLRGVGYALEKRPK